MSSWIYEVTSSYPSWSRSTSEPEVQNNLQCLLNFFGDYMTNEAIAGLAGNMLRESYMNPGQTQIGGSGQGLIQWTPGSIIVEYAASIGGIWYDGDIQCRRILEELEGTQGGYIPRGAYADISGLDFMQLEDVETATRAYYVNRERGANYESDMVISIPLALEFYDLLQEMRPEAGGDVIMYSKHAKYRRMKSRGKYL